MDQKEKVFLPLQTLLKEKRYEHLISILLDREKKNLKKLYRIDGNHAWYLLGVAYYKTMAYEASLGAFKKSIKNRKDDVQALFAIGNCYSELEKPDLAERYFRKSLYYYFFPKGAMKLSKYEIIYNLANSLFDQGKYEYAIALYLEIESPSAGLRRAALRNKKVAEEKLNALEK